MTRTLYLAGPITGNLDFRNDFAAAKLEVAQLGYVPISPLEVCMDAGLVEGQHSWKEFMQHDIRALIVCDGVYMLRGWEDSRGARIEQFLANALDLLVLYQSEEK